jgi:hypothetical protein
MPRWEVKGREWGEILARCRADRKRMWQRQIVSQVKIALRPEMASSQLKTWASALAERTAV